jgi:hypothetical protein
MTKGALMIGTGYVSLDEGRSSSLQYHNMSKPGGPDRTVVIENDVLPFVGRNPF